MSEHADWLERSMLMSIDPNALKVHSEAIVFDGHCDTILAMARGELDFRQGGTGGQIDLPRLQEGGVTCQIFAFGVIDPGKTPTNAAGKMLRLLDVFYRELEAGPGLRLATSAQDILTAKANGEVAAFLSIEGGEAIQGQLELLRMYYQLGIRAMGLTWNHPNEIANGVDEEFSSQGLTPFGYEVVSEMNRLGMVIDVSHLNQASFWNVVEATSAPFIASHSNAYALCPHRRNLTDEQLLAMAKLGGVAGVVFVPPFLDPKGKASLDILIDHIDHIAGLCGVDHIGIGSDFDGFTAEPDSGEVIPDVSAFPRLTERMLARGYKEDQVKQILGQNFLRVVERVVG